LTRLISFEAVARRGEISSDISYESWYQKLEPLGYTIVKNCVILRSLVLSQYQRVTDKQPDGQAAPQICYAVA